MLTFRERTRFDLSPVSLAGARGDRVGLWRWRGVGVARGAPRSAARAAARVGPSP